MGMTVQVENEIGVYRRSCEVKKKNGGIKLQPKEKPRKKYWCYYFMDKGGTVHDPTDGLPWHKYLADWTQPLAMTSCGVKRTIDEANGVPEGGKQSSNSGNDDSNEEVNVNDNRGDDFDSNEEGNVNDNRGDNPSRSAETADETAGEKQMSSVPHIEGLSDDQLVSLRLLAKRHSKSTKGTKVFQVGGPVANQQRGSASSS